MAATITLDGRTGQPENRILVVDTRASQPEGRDHEARWPRPSPWMGAPVSPRTASFSWIPARVSLKDATMSHDGHDHHPAWAHRSAREPHPRRGYPRESA